ncbi:MAG: hypothetical protein Q8O37_06115 [Sulfuricellaceae bacterium]|nr:hypothetical protein [Sulfuricellaceae bacterium]
MRNPAPWPIPKIIIVPLCLAFCLLFPAFTHAGVTTLPPLNPQELEAVVQEIKAMVKTDESRVEDFIVREATPKRIDQLYNMPELAQQPRIIRENGLIFAGQGSTLTFDRPSDIIARMSAWFPDGVAAARTPGRSVPFFGNIHLFGPYTSWGDEQAAFLVLWNCMPQIAWLKPTESPFMRRLNDGIPFQHIASRNSSELDFGMCVRERSTRRLARTRDDMLNNEAVLRRIGDRVSPVLRHKFSHHLASHRCQGTGPDDCVLNLLLWADLSSDDTELAAAIQSLEAEVAPDRPLPALQKPANQYGEGAQEGEPRFDQALRKAAFLRAKLVSVLNAPAAWPADALQTTFHQMTEMQRKIEATIDHRWSYYELDYHNEPLNPWSRLSLGSAQTPRVQAAIMAELDTIDNDVSCRIHAQWFKHGIKSLQTSYFLKRLTNNQPLQCVGIDWAGLKQGQYQEARELRDRLLAQLGNAGSGIMHERFLSNLTDDGQSCFDKKALSTTDWLWDVCARWVSEPQAVKAKLKHSRLTLTHAHKFRATSLEPLPDTAAQWLGRLTNNPADEQSG